MNFTPSALLAVSLSLVLAAPPAFAVKGHKIRAIPSTGMPLSAGAFAAGSAGSSKRFKYRGKFTLRAAARFSELKTNAHLPLQTVAQPPSAEVQSAPEPSQPRQPQDWRQGIAEQIQAALKAAGAAGQTDPSGESANETLGKLYAGGGSEDGSSAVPAAPGRWDQFPEARDKRLPILNNEGALVVGRAAVYYRAVMKWVEAWKKKVDLATTLDVMHDSYRDVVVKMDSLLAIADGRPVAAVNSHIDKTLEFVDGIAYFGGVKTAIHTHRVFVHPSHNPQSQIEEGKRRVSAYLENARKYYDPGGQADKIRIDPKNRNERKGIEKVILAFDTRGYKEIEDHIRKETKKWGSRYDIRFTSRYMKPLGGDQAVIKRLNQLTEKHSGDILRNIAEGVIYSRYVGLYLELKTIEEKVRQGHSIIESGRDLLDAKGIYITELDVVSKDKNGKVWINESKSARVDIPHEEVLQDKILYKLEIYLKNLALLNAKLGRGFGVNFPMGLEMRPHPITGERTFTPKSLALKHFLDDAVAELNAKKKYPFVITIEYIPGYPD